MDTSKLKKFAQAARQDLLEQVSSKLAFVLKPESPARRESPAVVNKLEKAMAAQGKAGLIDQVAYTWFNRFCALRFMDLNGYNRVGVVSPSEGQVQPEILAEAKSGIIDDAQFNRKMTDQILGLLNGAIQSPDAQSEAYRLLIVGSCNALYASMPYLFERIQDYTELLMPDDLLSENSILAKMRDAMTAESCQDVEIIGWLYQFYIAEKKDQVFAGLKKNQKITAENIPAATQLFTPHWIVRYLVENSLGRLWLLNRPNSKLAEQMDYYIAPEEPETDFLRINSPEDINVADPAVGSGHMLTYAFDLLYAIYEEEGYNATEIPALILTNNLTGVEIDDRAGALAAFALAMKAAERLGRRRFLRMKAKPDICVLQNVAFTEAELKDVAAVVGKDLFTDELRDTLGQFEQAKNFGSLIVPKLRDPAETLRVVVAWDFGGDLLLKEVQDRVVTVLRMAEALSPKYHVVVANPPYKKRQDLNESLAAWMEERFPSFKSDLFPCFVARCSRLSAGDAYVGIMSPNVWMFISSHLALRDLLTSSAHLTNLVELPLTGFDGATVQICAYNFRTSQNQPGPALFIRLVDVRGGATVMPAEAASAIANTTSQRRHKAVSSDFRSLPGHPIAYWVSDKFRDTFQSYEPLSSIGEARLGMATGNNDIYLRIWSEVSYSKAGFQIDSRDAALLSGKKWFPYNKGGPFRRWYGNNFFLVNWEQDGYSLRNTLHPSGKRIWAHNFNLDYIFKPCLTFTATSSSYFGVRYSPSGFLFDNKGSSYFATSGFTLPILGLLASKPATSVLAALNPTVEFQPGDISNIPAVNELSNTALEHCVSDIVAISQSDWDAYETSWDFTTPPLLLSDHCADTLEDTYARLRNHWQGMTDEMQRLEEENNRIFIDAYGLQDELTPEVPLKEITLTCNPAYRYGIKNAAAANEVRLRADTMAEFLSYAVGCMFGRYSLDSPGLILANQGETLADYLARIPEPTFTPDADNVIPLIDFDGDWFEDDIGERFKQFLRVTFGDERYGENLAFLEDALGKSIQKYFTKDFYSDHVKRYKKRPIYWLFSSPKGTFNALIYMHCYTSSTVSVVLNEYLREFRTKLEARKNNCEQTSINASVSQKEKTDALKMIVKLDKAIDEVNEYEREVLYPLAGQKIGIDLDDGVKSNYPLFGNALKTISGLS